MPQIVYRFSASGHADVARAFKNIGDQAAKAAGAEERASSKARAASDKATAAKSRDVAKAAGLEARKTAAVEREAKKRANIEIREMRRSSDAARRQYERQQAQHSRMREHAAKQRNERLGMLGSAALNGAATLGAGGVALVGAAARREFATRAKAREIAISTRGAGQAAVSQDDLVKEAHRTARATPGISAEDVLSGMKAFTTKTGDLDMARKMSGTFATVASATGADVTEIGSAGADLMQKFDIKSVDEMREAMARLTFQGKKGAFELKDAAAELPAIASAAQRFGLDKGTKGVATLGGIMQIAREATPSGAEAATSVEQMFTQLVAKSGKLKDAEWGGKGVNVFNADGTSRDIRDVLVDTIANVGGDDLEKKKMGLQGVFDVRGIRAVSPLIDAYAQAVKNGTDPIKAMREKLASAIDATGSWTEIQRDASMAQQSESAKLAAAWETLEASVGEAVIPELTKFVEGLAKNDAALQALAGTAGVALEALNAFAKALGIAAPPKNAEQAVADADKALADFDAKVAKRQAENQDAVTNENGLTAEEQAESTKLEKTRGSAIARRDALSKAAGGTLSQDEFKAEYERLGKEAPDPTEMDRIINGVVRSATQGLGGGVLGYFDKPESAEQKALVERAKGGAAPAGGGEDGSAATTGAAERLVDAAEALMRAAGMLPRANPLGTP